MNDFITNRVKDIIRILIRSLYITSFIYNANAQFTIDAGPDTIICYGPGYAGLINYKIGGNPTAFGGFEPYKYTWSGTRYLYPSSNRIGLFHASDDLNDTTIANPLFIQNGDLNDWYTLYLEVEDAMNNILLDSVKIRTSSYVYELTAPPVFDIELGDSVQLPGSGWVPIIGDFATSGFVLSPPYGLSDTTNLFCWAKPDSDIRYYVTVLNTAGCLSEPTPYFDVHIDPISKLEQNYQSIFGNHTTTWYQATESNSGIDQIKITAQKDWNNLTYVYRQLTIEGIEAEKDLYIREDRNAGRVWINDLKNLIMDLSLVKDDTFRLSYPATNDSLAIVDSVFIEDRRKHIRFGYQIHIDDNQVPLEFIEGIGPNAGFLYQMGELESMFSDSQMLLCAYKDSSRIYKNEKFVNDDCIYNDTQVNDINIEINNLIHPNPATDYIEIEHETSSKGIMLIYNITGIQVKSELVNSYEFTRIDVTDLKDGLYIVLFMSDDASKIMGKFIKTRGRF